MTFFSTIAAVWNAVWPYLIAVLVLFVVVVIHEFGHFLAAKLNGIRVNEFAFGFGPKLIHKKIGETEYAWRLIPFGGYCAMEGEDSESEDPRAFGNQPAWRRLIVVVMGALFNLILGFILAVCIVLPQERFATTRVARFEEDAVSVQSGLKEGDRILSANGRKVFTVYDLSYLMSTDEDGALDFVVERDGADVTLNGVQFALTEEDGQRHIKLDFVVYGEDRSFGSVIKNGFLTTLSYGRVVYMSFVDLIGGRFGLNDMSGPVGITAAIGSAAKQSLDSVLYIACLITINLGLFNLFPLPALDGGRAVFLLLEMIRRKPLPAKYEGFVHAAGFVLLFAFLILISFQDIVRLVTGG